MRVSSVSSPYVPRLVGGVSAVVDDDDAHIAASCLLAHNNIQQPHGKYSALEVHFRRMFSNIKYIVADMMTQLTDQADLTEV